VGHPPAAVSPNAYTKTRDAADNIGKFLKTAMVHLGKLNGPDQHPNPRNGWKETVRKSADNIDKQSAKISNNDLRAVGHFVADALRGLGD
jgi:hypothetical protein